MLCFRPLSSPRAFQRRPADRQWGFAAAARHPCTLSDSEYQTGLPPPYLSGTVAIQPTS
jgi:hypothetical protein